MKGVQTAGREAPASGSTPSPTVAAKEAERRLLADADYVYSVDNWEATHNDLGTLSDSHDLTCQYKGEVTVIGRLKELPSVYAVNLPTSVNEDGEADDWEVIVFPSREAALEAWDAASRAMSEAARAETKQSGIASNPLKPAASKQVGGGDE